MDYQLDNQIRRWRDGVLSDSEILGALLTAQFEVYQAMRKSEALVAEQRIKRLLKSHG